MILAPLRGVTIRAFRQVFRTPLKEAGFVEAVTPFIAANAGYDPLKDRELRPAADAAGDAIAITPQFIGKDPSALKASLERIKDAGYETADLNCGCPYPMVRNKGRGSGILKTPDVLRRMLDVGCATMGEGRFSVKTRLGIERSDELMKLVPLLNCYPLRFLTVHARTARQMYEGECDTKALEEVVAASVNKVVRNGDIDFSPKPDESAAPVMVGRSFIRALGERDDIGEYLEEYIALSRQELCGEHPVLGRIKELVSYWKDQPRWRRRWQVMKLARNIEELKVW